MKINNIDVIGNKFAYDGCHKIYIIENDDNLNEALKYGYGIYDISMIEEKYNESCSLRFIQNWNLNMYYTRQFEDATFKYNED